jgi:hypothetical protein
MAFDYGSKRPDGQYERYPTNTEGNFIAPYRDTYIHQTCETSTKVGTSIADTYAKNPTFYTRTFCVQCADHFPLDEFKWKDGVQVGKV